MRDEQRLFALIDGILGQITEEQAATALRPVRARPDGARRYRERTRPPARTSCTSWSTPTGCSGCRRCSSPRRTPPPAAGCSYELTWPAPGMGGAFGACHGLDVPLVFGNLDRGQPAMLIGDDLGRGGDRVGADACGLDGVRDRRGSRLAGVRADERLIRVFDTEPVVTADPE